MAVFNNLGQNGYTKKEAIILILAAKSLGALNYACDELDGFHKRSRRERKAERLEKRAEAIRSELRQQDEAAELLRKPLEEVAD